MIKIESDDMDAMLIASRLRHNSGYHTLKPAARGDG